MCKENSHEHKHTHEHDHEHEHSHNHNHTMTERNTFMNTVLMSMLHEHDHEHAHNGSHSHSHGEDHGHKHECKCESVENDNLSKEEKTLKLLLNHWVEHNKSHEEGFKDWVEKSKQMGRSETSDFIKKAIELMEKADEMLLEAQKHI